MVQKKVYLHLGMHKTGTTAIQVFCSNNAKALCDLGILYPEAGRPRATDVSYGHHLLPWSLNRHVTGPSFWPENIVEPRDVWQALVDEINGSDCDRVLLSSEEFDTLSAENIVDVFALLSQFEVQPIVYLRRLDEFSQGMYTTDVVYNGGKDTFEAYRSRMRTPMDYEVMISPWARTVSGGPIVRFYTPELSQEGIVTDFVTLLGLDAAQLGNAQASNRVNVGCWPWYVVETCRRMNECDLPSELVVKFAYIMRGVVGPTTRYDIIPPSEAAAEVQTGLSSLLRLGETLEIPDIPQFFQDVNVAMSDADWGKTRAEPHGAMLRVLQQISRLVDRP